MKSQKKEKDLHLSKNQPKKVFYYKDECNDEFFEVKAGHKIKIDQNYKYLDTSKFKKCCNTFLYYCIALPILSFWSKFINGTKIVGRKKLKMLKKQGCMIYGNHTHYSDSFVVATRIVSPKRTYIVSNSDPINKRGVRSMAKALGILPVGETPMALMHMSCAIKVVLSQKCAVVVYPEAHIWPYYTGLRPFPIASFKFASKNKVSVVPIATTYKKVWWKIKPQMVICVGDPLEYDENLSMIQNAERYQKYCYDYILTKVQNIDNYKYYEYKKQI